MKIVVIPNYVDFDLISGNSHYLTTARDEFGFNEWNIAIGMISHDAADKISADELITTTFITILKIRICTEVLKKWKVKFWLSFGRYS